ncbi:MAG: GGDEF domain-containing protein [Candidatus Gracilibacteria bacterium]|nr:GGDEF domain-containing protein [Candidatus Gracilibacteria bacterium]
MTKNLTPYLNEFRNALKGEEPEQRRGLLEKYTKLSQENIEWILNLDGTRQKKNTRVLLEDIGVESVESILEIDKYLQVEQYVPDVVQEVNERFSHVKISSIHHYKGEGIMEYQTNIDENTPTQSTEWKRLNSQEFIKNNPLGTEIKNGIHYVGNGEKVQKGDIDMTFKMEIGENEYIVFNFENISHDVYQIKHDLLAIKNLFQIKGIGKEIKLKTQLLIAKYTDGMTGLLNNDFFEKLLDSPEGHDYSGVIIDISKFKRINKLYGQNGGDAFIKHVAKHLQSIVRPDDIVTRIGGDEFFILFKNNSNTVDPNELKAEIEKKLEGFMDRVQKENIVNEQYLMMDDIPVSYELKFGSVVSLPDSSLDSEDMKKTADSNMVKDPIGTGMRIDESLQELLDNEHDITMKMLLLNKRYCDNFFIALTNINSFEEEYKRAVQYDTLTKKQKSQYVDKMYFRSKLISFINQDQDSLSLNASEKEKEQIKEFFIKMSILEGKSIEELNEMIIYSEQKKKEQKK